MKKDIITPFTNLSIQHSFGASHYNAIYHQLISINEKETITQLTHSEFVWS